MKIINAHKWDCGSGGAGRFYLNHEKIMLSRGHEVIPWATAYSGNRGGAVSQDFFAPRSVDFGQFDKLGVLEKLSVAARVVWHLPAARALTEAIDHFKPDIVHLHNVYHQFSGSVIDAAAACDVPIVQSLHDFSHFCIQSHFYRDGAPCYKCLDGGLYQGVRYKCFNRSLLGSALTALSRWVAERKRLLAKVSGFTTPSEEVKDILVKCGLPHSKILVVDNPFLVEDVPFKAPPWPAVGDYIAAWGTFAEMKGFGTLLDAIERMRSPICLKLFAKDVHAASPALRERVDRLAAEGRLELIEHIRYGEALFQELSRARLLVAPSEWPVTQEYAVWEGMLLGRPVVVGSLGGNKELVGFNELVFRAGDAESLAALLDNLLSQSERDLAALGQQLRSRVMLKSDPAVYGEKLESFYRGIS